MKIKIPSFNSEPERRSFQVPKDLLVSDWANKSRYLDPLTSAEPGQWMTDRTPYIKGIMDAFIDPVVEEIVIMASTQVGKTESMLNMLGYVVDQDPAPALWVMPRETDAKGISKDRIFPMINLSPALTSHRTQDKDDVTRLEITLDRMIVYLVGANSPAGLAQKPIRYLFLDETDKYPKFSGREADPIKLATERTRTFWNRKVVKCSTPTTREGYIANEYERTDRCRYYVPCPHCGEYQVFVFSQIKWSSEERDAEVIKEDKLAWYECLFCHEKITDSHKQKMLPQGKWIQSGQEVNRHGKITGKPKIASKKGFWINAIYSPWLTISEIAAEFIHSKDEPNLLMNFVNSWLAEVWEEKTEEREPDKIKMLALDYDEGTLPGGVMVLTGGVDVQKDHFYLVIRGWGVGLESWLIRALRVESWEEVLSILFETQYRKEDRSLLSVRLACIDSGFRTDEVYEVSRRWRDVLRPTKGDASVTGVPFKITRIDRNPKTGAVIEGGITLWRVDVSFYKDKIARLVSTKDPIKWHLFKNPTEDYLKQFCAEHKIIIRNKKTGEAKELWMKKTHATPNHFLDSEVCAVAAADMLYVSTLREEGKKEIYEPEKREERERTPWIGNRKGWFQ